MDTFCIVFLLIYLTCSNKQLSSKCWNKCLNMSHKTENKATFELSAGIDPARGHNLLHVRGKSRRTAAENSRSLMWIKSFHITFRAAAPLQSTFPGCWIRFYWMSHFHKAPRTTLEPVHEKWINGKKVVVCLCKRIIPNHDLLQPHGKQVVERN